jgi:hypothetical protein
MTPEHAGTVVLSGRGLPVAWFLDAADAIGWAQREAHAGRGPMFEIPMERLSVERCPLCRGFLVLAARHDAVCLVCRGG